MNPLTPDEESSLRWYATGAYAADLGDKSPLGSILDRARAGQTRCQSSPEMRDIGPAAERFARVHERVLRVREADPGGADALLWFYGGFEENAHRERNEDGTLKEPDDVPDHGHYTKPLPAHGDVGVVMWKLSGMSVKAINNEAEKARKPKAKGHAAARTRIESLRVAANKVLAQGWVAYAATRQAPKTDAATLDRKAEARRAREAERRGHYANRTQGREVVFEGPRRRAV